MSPRTSRKRFATQAPPRSSWRTFTFCVLTAWAVVGAAAFARAAEFGFSTVLSDAPDVQADVQAREAELTGHLDRVRGGLPEAEVRVALANWYVAEPAARPATRLLLGLETTDDRRAIVAAAEKASEHIERARQLLEEVEPQADEDKRLKRRLLQMSDTVAAFVELFGAVRLGPDTDEATAETWRKAGRGLAVARESLEPQVAAAAQLWQAYALDRAGRRERALEVLAPALAKPEELPYDLLSRLLRMRLVADSGEYAAAVGLLARMEWALNDWMDNRDQRRNNARRLVGLLRHKIVTTWLRHLRDAEQVEAAAHLEPMLAEIERGFAEIKQPDLYYMPTAVPLIVTMPAGSGPNPAPANSEPETAPAQ